MDLRIMAWVATNRSTAERWASLVVWDKRRSCYQWKGHVKPLNKDKTNDEIFEALRKIFNVSPGGNLLGIDIVEAFNQIIRCVDEPQSDSVGDRKA